MAPDVFEKTVAWIRKPDWSARRFTVDPLPCHRPSRCSPKWQSEAGCCIRTVANGHGSRRVPPKRLCRSSIATGYAWCYRRLFRSLDLGAPAPRDAGAVPRIGRCQYLYRVPIRLGIFDSPPTNGQVRAGLASRSPTAKRKRKEPPTHFASPHCWTRRRSNNYARPHRGGGV